MKIVLIVALSLFFIGCTQEKSKTAKEEISSSIEKITDVVKEESSNIKQSVTKATEDSVETIKEEAKEVTQTVLKETKKVVQKSVTSIDKVLEESAAKIETIKEPIVEPVKTVVENKIDGGALFSKCSSCHGVNADKKALNKSQSIKGWSVAKLTTAINGYKDGTYGGSMKGVMKPQVNNLSDDEVEALAAYISKL